MNGKDLLGETQRKLLNVALGMLATAFIFAFLFSIFLLLRSFVQTFSNVLWPLAVAGILTMILRPIVLFFEDKFKVGRNGSIILLYGMVVLVFAFLMAIFLPIVFSQLIKFVEYIPEFIQSANEFFSKKYPDISAYLSKTFGDNWLEQLKATFADNITGFASASLPALNKFKDFAISISAIAAGGAIIPVYLFFFLESNRDVKSDLETQLSFVPEKWRLDIIFLIQEFVSSVIAFFRGQILVGLIMGILLAIGFSIAGLNFAIILGLFIGALNIIPYLGTIIGLGTVLPLAYFQPDGGLILLGFSLLVFIVVQMIEGYLLTPKIMGKTTGLHPLAIIIAIFFWGTALNGILGMILAIPLTAFFVVAWRLVRKKYLSNEIEV